VNSRFQFHEFTISIGDTVDYKANERIDYREKKYQRSFTYLFQLMHAYEFIYR
jgi:hypothetical protein